MLPAGMIGAVAMAALNSPLGDVLALVWGLAVLPAVALTIMRRSPEGLARLRDLVPADLTAHWEIVCKLLEILPTAWPASVRWGWC